MARRCLIVLGLLVLGLIALTTAVVAQAETHRVIGTEYYHTFSAAHPVLKRVKPGDTIVTKTVDSAGFDFEGVRRTKTHGNPLTGAFYIEGAEPGDALVVHLRKVRVNRNSGYTGYQIGIASLAENERPPKPGDGAAIRGYDYLRPWFIDLERQVARLREPRTGKTPLEYPVEPMLGCIGVAPKGDFSPRSGPAGYWGGNLDYNLVREGATVYLPVFHAGALLFFGDGHALQGDGEAIGSGVETSLDVEVTVDVRKGWTLPGPRLENAEWIVAIGSRADPPSLNANAEIATADMLRWLGADYQLEPWESHLILGTRARYDVITLGGSVGLRVPKAALRRR